MRGMAVLPKPERRGPKPRKPIQRSRGKAGKRTSKHRRRRLSLVKLADNAARAKCHMRNRCEAAGWRGTSCSGPLQWAHIMSRSYRRNNLRWRMDNCLALCAGHHWRWTKKNEAEWRAFLYDKIGLEKVLSLEWEALHGDKPDPARALAGLVSAAPDAGTHGPTGCI